jgi:hypothetical protein
MVQGPILSQVQIRRAPPPTRMLNQHLVGLVMAPVPVQSLPVQPIVIQIVLQADLTLVLTQNKIEMQIEKGPASLSGCERPSSLLSPASWEYNISRR